MRARSTLRKIALAALVLALGRPPEARGWGNTWIGIDLEEAYNALRWRSGLLRGGGVLTLGNAGYSSDIFYGSTPEPTPDYTATAGASVRGMLPLSRKLIAEASATPEYLFFLHTSGERAFNGIASGNLHLVLDRLYVMAGGEYRNMRERLGPELDINIRRQEAALTGLALWQVSRQASFALQYRRAAYNYGDTGQTGIRERLNRIEDYINVRAYLQQIAKIRYYLDGEYGSFSFTQDPTHFRDARSYGVYACVDINPEAATDPHNRQITGAIRLGYGKFDLRNPTQKDFTGMAGSAKLTIPLMRRTSVNGFFERGAAFSVFAGMSYYLQTSFGGGLTRALTRRITLSYDFAMSRLAYPESGAEGEPSSQLRSAYTVHSIRLGTQLRRNLFLNLLASFSTRTSSVLIRAGGRNFFGFGLTYGVSPGTATGIVDPTAR